MSRHFQIQQWRRGDSDESSKGLDQDGLVPRHGLCAARQGSEEGAEERGAVCSTQSRDARPGDGWPCPSTVSTGYLRTAPSELAVAQRKGPSLGPGLEKLQRERSAGWGWCTPEAAPQESGGWKPWTKLWAGPRPLCGLQKILPGSCSLLWPQASRACGHLTPGPASAFKLGLSSLTSSPSSANLGHKRPAS